MTAFVGASQAANGAPAGSLTSVSSILFYLVAYGAATIGAFAVVTMVRDTSGEATLLSSWAGLGRRSPAHRGLVFSVFLLSFAGIPLTSGFIGKWAVFAAAWTGGAHWLVVVAVVISVVAAFFYIRVIVLMFFTDPEPGRPPTLGVSVGPAAGGDPAGGGGRGRRDRGAGGVPRAGAGPRAAGGRVHPVSPASPPLRRPVWLPAPDRLTQPTGAGGGAKCLQRGRVTTSSRSSVRGQLDAVEVALLQAGRGPDADGHRGRSAHHRRRRQAVPAPARRPRPPSSDRLRADEDVVTRRRRGRAHPRRQPLPRRRDGRGPAAPRLGQRQLPLGQHRRHPGRRLPLRPRLRPGVRARPRVRLPAGPHLRPAGPGPDRRDGRPAAGRGPPRPLPAGAGRQDRRPHRHLGAVRRQDLRLLARRCSSGSPSSASRSGWSSSSATTSSTSPATHGQDARHRPARGHPDAADPAGPALRRTRPTPGCWSCSTPTCSDDDRPGRGARPAAPAPRHRRRPRPRWSAGRRWPAALLDDVPPGPARLALEELCDSVVSRSV